jgi:serine/threonine-protein kinase
MTKYAPYILYLLTSILVVILLVNGFGPLDNLQSSIDDFLCEVTATDDPRPGVAIVQIDDRAQEEFGRWPWNRDLIADLAAAVATGQPKAVVIDLDLYEDPDQDSAGYTDILASQLTWIEQAVLPYDIALATFRRNKTIPHEFIFKNSIVVDNPIGIMDEQSSLQVRKVFPPAEKLLAHDPHLGFEYHEPDDDRILRHQPLAMQFDGYYYPSLSLMAAMVYLGVPSSEVVITEGQHIEIGDQRRVPIDNHGRYFVNFPKDGCFTVYSAYHVLSEGFNLKDLEDKLVFVVVDNFRAGEWFTTPVNAELPDRLLAPVIAENIINNDFLTRSSDNTGLLMLIIFALGGALAFVLPRVNLMYRLIIIGGLLVVLANANYLLVSSFRMIPDTVYIALQLVLFMVASPFLESELLGGRVQAPSSKAGKKKPVAKPDKADRSAPVRELGDTGGTEQMPTTAFEAGQSDSGRTETDGEHDGHSLHDYQTIALDGDGGSPDSEPTEVDGADSGELEADGHGGDSGSHPEIISPTSHYDEEPPPQEGENAYAEEPVSDSQRIAVEITSLGRYQITGALGRGAMGMVYKGVDPAINRPVALKTIRLDFLNDPNEIAELKERLHREAQAAGKLSHPNIVTIYDVGSEGPLQYIAMEYLEGRTLEQLIKKKVKFNYKIIAKIIIQICEALEYAHERGIVHRDIKPANVMVLDEYRVKVMDYGIARIDSNSMTKTGIAMGTPNYISPEQLQGQSVDCRADIFSLGVVMYEMLLGRRPFRGENITSLIYSIVNNEPEKPSNLNPQIPLLFDHIITRALKKNPPERYQRAKDIVRDLHDFVESFSTKYRAATRRHRNAALHQESGVLTFASGRHRAGRPDYSFFSEPGFLSRISSASDRATPDSITSTPSCSKSDDISSRLSAAYSEQAAPFSTTRPDSRSGVSAMKVTSPSSSDIT